MKGDHVGEKMFKVIASLIVPWYTVHQEGFGSPGSRYNNFSNYSTYEAPCHPAEKNMSSHPINQQSRCINPRNGDGHQPSSRDINIHISKDSLFFRWGPTMSSNNATTLTHMSPI